MLIKKVLTRLGMAISLLTIVSLVQAHQVNNVEVLKLVNEGVLKNTNELTQIALSEHLGSEIRSGSELKQIYGRYIYRVALLDIKKIKWNVDLDAKTGKVISNMID